MTPEQRERIREIFLAACEKDPQERLAFLQRACQGDELVRREAESLLASDDEADAFLQTPILGKTFSDARPESLLEGAASPAVEDEPDPGPDPHRHDTFPDRIGQYRILGILGKGGMGVVYRAEQESPRRPVALKVVRPGVESHEALRRFEREGQVLGKLQHPGIAQVFEAGTADTDLGSQPFFAMELVHGRPLTQYAQGKRLDLRARLELIARVCSAVHHAHQKGVIHRDLKPGNILVDERGHPKVVDFGVARATDADVRTATLHTAVGQLVGTIAYMSPEQIEGDPHDLDTRSDVYSLGVILYELLTGRLPVEVSAKTIPQAARAIVEQESPSLSSVNRIWRGDVETIVAKALQKDRERRYQSASSFADDIRRYLSDQPIAARPVTTMYQLRKFARRNKALVVSVAAVFVVLCMALVGVTTEWNRALEAEELAAKRRESAEHKAYLANIAAAHAALQGNDVVTARRRLREAPAPLRRWEWRYLDARLDVSLMTLHESETKVWGVAFSPDSRWVGAAARDGTIGIWDAATGKVHRMLMTGNANLMCLCFNPDGTRMIVGAETGRPLELWDTDTGEQLTTFQGHTQTVWDVAFSADGALIASASLDGTARIWDANSGKQKAVLEHPSWVCCAAFNPDATQLVTNCRDNIARVWDLTTSEPVLEITVAPQTDDWDYVHSWAVAFSPDAETLATGGHDGLIQIWNAATGALVQNISGHTGRVRSLAYSPDGLHLASSSDDCTVRVWELAHGVESAKLRGHGRSIHRVAFSPDGSRLATGSDDGTVRLWDPRSNWKMTRLWGHKNDAINSIAITPDGSRLVSVGGDAVMRLWSPMSGVGLKAMRGHDSYIFDVSLSSDGKLAATASADRMVGLWNIAVGDNIAMLAGHDGWVTAVAFSPDCTHVASAGRDGTMRLWDAVSHSAVMTIRSENGALTAIDFSPEGQVIATGSQEGSVELWDARTGQRMRGAKEHEAAVSRVVFSPDGECLASASHDHTLKLWNAQTLVTINTLRRHTDVVSGAAFSPDGLRLASVSFDGNLHIWEVATGDAVLSFRAHNDWAWDVTFSADGTLLASSSKSIQLWETEQPNQSVVQQRLARTLAEDLVESLSARLKTPDEVIARLELEADIADDVRQLAIQTAEFRKP